MPSYMKMQRIKRFGVVQTAKVAAVIYFIMIAVFFLPFALIGYVTGLLNDFGPFGGTMFLLAPIFYGAIAFVATAIGCLIYNAIATRIGGIEVELETAEAVGVSE